MKSIKPLCLLAILVAGILATGTFSGCSKPSVQAANGIEQSIVVPQAAIVAIDGTASYEYLTVAKESACRIVHQMAPGSKIFIRWISDNSYADKVSIVSASFPTLPPKPSPFDVRGRAKYAAREKNIAILKQQICDKITKAISPNAGHTDIYGVLSAASERIASNADFQPRIFLLSDMDDNCSKRTDTIKLAGASVYILNYQVKDAKADRKTFWIDELTRFGAVEVKFSHMDDFLTTTAE